MYSCVLCVPVMNIYFLAGNNVVVTQVVGVSNVGVVASYIFFCFAVFKRNHIPFPASCVPVVDMLLAGRWKQVYLESLVGRACFLYII